MKHPQARPRRVEATRRQRTLRAIALMSIGGVGGALLTLDPVGAFTSPPFLLMLVAMCSWTAIENALLRQDEPKEYKAKLQTRIMQATVMVAIFAGVVDAWHLPAIAARTWALTIAGLTVIAAGAGIRFLAIRTLDRHFSYELRVEKGHEIVQHGIYGTLRHPSYLGIVLICVGAPLAVQSVAGALLGLVVMGGVVVWRIATEEAILREAFPKAYDEYARRTWRLVPYVY